LLYRHLHTCLFSPVLTCSALYISTHISGCCRATGCRTVSEYRRGHTDASICACYMIFQLMQNWVLQKGGH
jgi:hypothetical protein